MFLLVQDCCKLWAVDFTKSFSFSEMKLFLKNISFVFAKKFFFSLLFMELTVLFFFELVQEGMKKQKEYLSFCPEILGI